MSSSKNSKALGTPTARSGWMPKAIRIFRRSERECGRFERPISREDGTGYLPSASFESLVLSAGDLLSSRCTFCAADVFRIIRIAAQKTRLPIRIDTSPTAAKTPPKPSDFSTRGSTTQKPPPRMSAKPNSTTEIYLDDPENEIAESFHGHSPICVFPIACLGFAIKSKASRAEWQTGVCRKGNPELATVWPAGRSGSRRVVQISRCLPVIDHVSRAIHLYWQP